MRKPVFSSLRSFVGKPYRSVRMYLPIALVAFALGFPALAAAEITLEPPVSDITLVLNETVTIQFPQGTTNSIKKKGKWRHRIAKKPRLPEGLTFDQSTRTLSGTPVEEHDATHSYRIRYVWGQRENQQEKLVVQFRLVVKKPDPIAVEITPEQPLSDLTLVLNKPVTVQFPGGTTEQIQENGEWKYRIKRYRVKDDTLPAGLTFNRATRTLSGTPSEEHNAKYAYHIQYVWGKGKANMERLVIPFRLVVKKPDPIGDRIRAFIGEASSVGEFATGLPDLHKSQSLYMIESQALDSDFVSEEYPRMLSFGADARTIFAWGSDPDSDRYDIVEFIAAGEGRWHFGVIDFAEDPPAVTRDPEECQSCHNNHPLWATYDIWPGTLFEFSNSKLSEFSSRGRSVRSYGHDKTLEVNFRYSSDPRISAVGRTLSIFSIGGMPGEFSNQLAIRHGELLAKQVIAQPDFYTVAEKFVCGTYGGLNLFPVVYAHWPKREIDLTRMGEGLERIDPSTPLPPPPYHSGNAVLERVIVLLIINHLYETDSEIQAIYDSTSNTESPPRIPEYLHFAPGTATMADELRSRVKLVELAGQANMDRRRALRTSPRKDMVLGAAHLDIMAPKVCNALRARDND